MILKFGKVKNENVKTSDKDLKLRKIEDPPHGLDNKIAFLDENKNFEQLQVGLPLITKDFFNKSFESANE